MTDYKARAEELRSQIQKANHAYYNNDAPEISDRAYDMLLAELAQLEAEHPELADTNSPTNKIGGEPASTAVKITHKRPLLSLLDVFSLDELDAWIGNTGHDPDVSVESKIDGLSCALTYDDGNLTLGATRGDGHIGEDVTANVLKIKNIPKAIPGLTGRVIIRCEVYMPRDVFERLNQELIAAGKKPMKNPRNAAAGALRLNNPDESERRGLRAAAFDIMYSGHNQIPENQTDRIAWLADHGFETAVCIPCDSITAIHDAINQIDASRDSYPFPIDGAAVKLNNLNIQAAMGTNEKYPKWAVAFKYPPEQKATAIRDIALQTGRTGTVTPIAVFDPVELAGTTVTKATLHNQSFMDVVLGGVAIGDVIIVHKSGEIIPEVLKVLHDKRPAGIENFKMTHCPSCGSELLLAADEDGEGTRMVCANPFCQAILPRTIEYWCSKHVMDIHGIGPKAITALINADLIKSIADIYCLDQAKLDAIPEVGPVRGPKLLAEIEKSKAKGMEHVIAGLGIPGVGRHIGKALAAVYPDVRTAFAAASKHKLVNLEGIGQITEDDIRLWYENTRNTMLLNRLENLGVDLTSKAMKNTAPGALSGMTFVITGTLNGMTRDEAQAALEALGAKISGSVSKKTSYVIAGEAAGGKYTKAVSLGIPILTSDDLKTILASGSLPA